MIGRRFRCQQGARGGSNVKTPDPPDVQPTVRPGLTPVSSYGPPAREQMKYKKAALRPQPQRLRLAPGLVGDTRCARD